MSRPTRVTKAGDGGLPPGLVFTVDEAAAILRLKRTATYDAIHRGQLRAVRLGRKFRVPRAAIEELLGGGSAPVAGGRSEAPTSDTPSNGKV